MAGLGVSNHPKKSKGQLGWGKSFPRRVIKTRGLMAQSMLCLVSNERKFNLNSLCGVHFVMLLSCEKLHLIEDVVIVNTGSTRSYVKTLKLLLHVT